MKNKLYNAYFPIWILIFLPQTWLLALPINFVIDSLVLIIMLKILRVGNIKEVYKKSIFSVFLLGFVSDIIGASPLLLTLFFGGNVNTIWNDICKSINTNPFSNIFGFGYLILCIVISGVLIYWFNIKFSLKKTNLKSIEIKKIALALAIITAPYTLLVPTDMFSNYYDYQMYEDYKNENINRESLYEFDKFIDKYKDTYIGDNRITKVFYDSQNYINEMYYSAYVIDASYKIDIEKYNLTCNLNLSKSFNINDEEEYNQLYRALEKSSLLTIALSNNAESITANITNNDIQKTLKFTRENLEKKYNIDFNNVLDDSSTFRKILLNEQN